MGSVLLMGQVLPNTFSWESLSLLLENTARIMAWYNPGLDPRLWSLLVLGVGCLVVWVTRKIIGLLLQILMWGLMAYMTAVVMWFMVMGPATP